MATAYQKTRTIVLSNVHTLLDKVTNWNDIGALEQHARDLQTARDTLDDQAAALRSDVKTLPVEIIGLDARHKAADANITTLLTDNDPSNDSQAAVLEAQLMTLEDQIKTKHTKLDAAKEELVKFDDMVAKIDLKRANVDGQIAVLRDLKDTTTAKEKSAKLLSGVALSEMPNVDNVAERLRRRAAVADNKLDRELGRVTGSVADSTLDATVAARLAARRQALSAKK